MPGDFAARIRVYFVYGGQSSGFAFGGDDVYVNLAFFSDASAQELAETVSHEVFHAVQSHLAFSLPELPRPDNKLSGAIWAHMLLGSLLQEGTAELFTHKLHPDTRSKSVMEQNERIGRNSRRIDYIITLFESITFRLLSNPPKDGAGYDRIYGLAFYTDFDANGYELGWRMARTIEEKDGKAAIFALLKQHPKQFILRYQAIAKADPKLAAFSDEFIQMLNTRIP